MPLRTVALLLAVLLLLGVAPSATTAQEAGPSATVSVPDGPFTVGDPIPVRVEVRYPPGATVTPPALDPALGPFEVVEPPRESRAPADGGEVLTYEFTVAAYQPGTLTLPPLRFTYQGPGEPPRTLTAPATAVTIASVLPPDGGAALRDLKPQAELALPAARPLWWAAPAAAAVLVAAAAGFLMVRRRRARPRPDLRPPAAPRAPEDAAVAELDRIAGMRLIERREFQTFYLLLADCIRRYLTERYGFPAVALTTSELRASMEPAGVSRWQARLVDGLLVECDAVVYAGYVPAAARAEGDLAVAYEIVEMTRAREEAPQEAAV
ncbi:MAG TPA: BatD family protein [Dehalococcoidia bacterium]